MIFAAGADDELTDASGAVQLSVRILRGETLVVMIVPAEDHIRVCVVQRLVERLYFRSVAVRATRTE